MKKVFVSVDNPEQWMVFEEEKQEGFRYELASIEDLNDYVAATGEYFQKVETVEGLVQWYTEEKAYEDEEDYICEYRVIKEC
jgi:hypothetical protein